MTSAQQKVVQYLNEAHATEHRAGARAAVADRDDAARDVPHRPGDAPRRDPRPRRARRAAPAGARRRARNPLHGVVGVAETVVGQALALGKTPFDLLRGSGGEEKVLKNAKDACATEALEIATYTAIERLAAPVGDDETGRAGRVDPRRRGEDARAHPARDPEAHRRRRRRRHRRRRRPTTSPRPAPPTPSARPARRPRRRAQGDAATKRTARQARKVPGVAQAEGQVKGAVAPRATWRSRATTR